MTIALVTLAVLTAGQAAPASAMPPASELIDLALAAYQATPFEDRRDEESLINALIDLGRVDMAYRVATANPQYAQHALSSRYGPRLARRLGRVPPEDDLVKIAPPGSRDRDIAFGRIARALAKANNPSAAEDALRMISDREPGPMNRVLAAGPIAEAYWRAKDSSGERRLVRLGLEEATGVSPDFFVFENNGRWFVDRAPTLSEHDALRAFLGAAVAAATRPEGFLKTFPHHEVPFWSCVGRARHALGEDSAAQEAFAAARRLAEAYEADRKQSIDRHYAVQNFLFLGSSLRRSGFDDEGEDVIRRATDVLAAESLSPWVILRSTLLSLLWRGDFETPERIVEAFEEPTFRIAANVDIVNVAVRQRDPSASQRLADLRDELRKVKRIGRLGDGWYRPEGVLCEAASIHISADEIEEGRKIFSRATRWAKRDLERAGDDYALCSIVISQCEAGLPEDAWATFQSTSHDSARRAECLAKIAAAAAEREADLAGK